MNYAPIYEPYIHLTEDENGALRSISFHNTERFNFAFDIVDEIARRTPDKLAMLHVAKNKRERRLSFRDMSVYSSKIAAYFQSLGIKKGDRVMLVLKRHYHFWFAILALHKLGAIVIPTTSLLKHHDYKYRFEAAGVKAIVCTADDDVAYQVDLAADELQDPPIRILVRGKRKGWETLTRAVYDFDEVFVPTERAGGREPSIMFFTSGTTGYPKIVTHDFTYPLGHLITAKYWHRVDPDGIHYTVSDTGWGKALWGKLYGQWLCEAAVFTYDVDSFDAGELLEMIEHFQITTFCAPPTVYRMMIRKDFSRYDLSCLQHVTTAGEALNPEVFNQFYEKTGLALYEGFGQTEMTLAIGTLVGDTPKPGSMGKPTPMFDADVIDENGNSIAPGGTGEIVIRTPDMKNPPVGLLTEYYRNEELTREAWHDGIYHTGDLATRDEDGYLWYVGRDDDVIKSAGYRIGPFEIESILMELPYVLECGVTTTQGKIRGQVIKACIVLTDGTEGTDDLKKEIQRYARKNMASYKYPRIIEFRDELPKTISGKIQHNKL